MSVESLQAIADAVDLPPDVVRAIVTYSDRPDAMHLEMTAGWLRAYGCASVDVEDSFIEFLRLDGNPRWWRLQAIDEGGGLRGGLYAERSHDYTLYRNTTDEPVFIPGGMSPRELATRALNEARRIEGAR